MNAIATLITLALSSAHSPLPPQKDPAGLLDIQDIRLGMTRRDIERVCGSDFIQNALVDPPLRDRHRSGDRPWRFMAKYPDAESSWLTVRFHGGVVIGIDLRLSGDAETLRGGYRASQKGLSEKLGYRPVDETETVDEGKVSLWSTWGETQGRAVWLYYYGPEDPSLTLTLGLLEVTPWEEASLPVVR